MNMFVHPNGTLTSSNESTVDRSDCEINTRVNLLQCYTPYQATLVPQQPIVDVCIRDRRTFAVSSLKENREFPNNYVGEVYVVDTESKSAIRPLRCFSGISRVSFNKYNENMLVAGAIGGSVNIWDLRTRKQIGHILPSTTSGHLKSIVVAEVIDRDILLSMDVRGNICKWALANLIKPLDIIKWRFSPQFSRVTTANYEDGLIGGCVNGQIFNSDISHNIPDFTGGHNSLITSVVSTRFNSREYLATGSFDCSVKIWDAKKMRPVHDMLPSLGHIRDLQWNPTHPNVLAGLAEGGLLFIWDLEGKTKNPAVTQKIGDDNRIAWVDGGRKLMSCGTCISLWDASSVVWGL